MLKNYTSNQSASRSISYIEQKLIQQGANKILKIYDEDCRLKAICFSIIIDGEDISFKLPAKVKACETVLLSNLSARARPETRKKVPQQAERTAWKILQDWVEAQMAMIELSQTEIMEVFLPYVFNNQTEQTFFEQIKSKGYAKLLPKPGDLT